jgi:flagellar biosynthetic protein FliQ
MESIAISLMTESLDTAAILALPVVIAVAVVGIVIGVLQTVVQVQDQNVAFAPKLVTVAIVVSLAGPGALAIIRTLLITAIQTLPEFARS